MKRKRLLHHASRESKFDADLVFACWDSLFMKNPLLAQRWADVTCPKCLKRKGTIRIPVKGSNVF